MTVCYSGFHQTLHILHPGEHMLTETCAAMYWSHENCVSLNAGILFLWDIILGKSNKEESLNYPSNWMHTEKCHFVGRSSGASAMPIENGYEKRLKLKPLFFKSCNLVSNSSFCSNIRWMYFRELQMLWFQQSWKMHRVPVFSLRFQKK